MADDGIGSGPTKRVVESVVQATVGGGSAVGPKSWGAHRTGGASEATWADFETVGGNPTTWADLET